MQVERDRRSARSRINENGFKPRYGGDDTGGNSLWEVAAGRQ